MTNKNEKKEPIQLKQDKINLPKNEVNTLNELLVRILRLLGVTTNESEEEDNSSN